MDCCSAQGSRLRLPCLTGYIPRFHNTSPEVTPTWKLEDAVTIYRSFKTAFRSGGYSISMRLPDGLDHHPVWAIAQKRDRRAGQADSVQLADKITVNYKHSYIDYISFHGYSESPVSEMLSE